MLFSSSPTQTELQPFTQLGQVVSMAPDGSAVCVTDGGMTTSQNYKGCLWQIKKVNDIFEVGDSNNTMVNPFGANSYFGLCCSVSNYGLAYVGAPGVNKAARYQAGIMQEMINTFTFTGTGGAPNNNRYGFGASIYVDAAGKNVAVGAPRDTVGGSYVNIFNGGDRHLLTQKHSTRPVELEV